MGWIENFHFIRPLWLFSLIPAAWLWWKLRANSSFVSRWRDVVDPALLDHLLVGDGVASGSSRWYWWVGLAWLIGVIALAGPSWERRETPTFRNVTERVLVIDLSRSMDARDIKPSRLIRVRQKVEDILNRSGEVENAIVVYAASPFVVSPLTNDAATIRSMLSALKVDIMPAQGSRTVLALHQARELLHSVKSKRGQVVLFTDSPVDEAAHTAAAALAADGFKFSVIGVGSVEGAPVPNPRAGFLKDRSGGIVVARLDEASLKSLAAAGGGEYRMITPDESDIKSLLDDFNRSALSVDNSTDDDTSQTIEAWLDRGPWLIWLLLPIAAVAFRRGWL